MTLPLSRNTTYAASDPILAADLDDIQDCIIGRKHGTIEITVPACAFVLQTGTITIGAGVVTFGAVSIINAPLQLPVGTKISTVAWSYNRGNAGTLNLRVKRKAVGGGSVSDVDTVSDNTGATYEITTRTLNHTVATGYQYYLEVQADNSAIVFEEATLMLTKE